MSITSVAIFLREPIFGYLAGYARVKSASNISSIIGSYVSSASKANSDGFFKPGKFRTMPVDAIKDQPKLALVCSGSLTITSGVLVIMVLVLAVAELWLPVGEPLGIASLKKALEFEESQT
jgi:hypothetical protein